MALSVDPVGASPDFAAPTLETLPRRSSGTCGPTSTSTNGPAGRRPFPGVRGGPTRNAQTTRRHCRRPRPSERRSRTVRSERDGSRANPSVQPRSRSARGSRSARQRGRPIDQRPSFKVIGPAVDCLANDRDAVVCGAYVGPVSDDARMARGCSTNAREEFVIQRCRRSLGHPAIVGCVMAR